MTSKLGSPIELPSGLVLPNRLVKAAMSETMSDDNSDPGDKYLSAYTNWASGNWGGILTGNVDVSTIYRGDSNTVAVNPTITKTSRDAWTRWALATQREGTPGIVQLIHPGRQSPVKNGNRKFMDKTIAPSPVALNIGNGLVERFAAALLFGTPREMTQADIDEVVQQFATAAKMCYESGFKGIQLHGAHGYLLTQFLSAKMNFRTDAYGGTVAKRAKIVIDILRAIKKEVPSSFSICIKLNSADIVGAENLEESLEQLGLIAKEGIDFIEISGGSYENPRMAIGDNPKAARTAQREAFFLDYAKAVRARYPNLVLMVTGGFRSRAGMVAALESNACDLVGIARPAAVYPHLPKDVYLNEQVKDEDAVIDLPMVKPSWLISMIPIRLIGLGVDSLYYAKQIKAMGVGQQPQPPPRG